MSVDGYGHSASHGALTGLDLDDHRQYVPHHIALARRNLTGGGLLTWDGRYLSFSYRLIWLPAGTGGFGHISLSAGTIDTTADSWMIAFLRLTDAQMSTTSSLTFTTADVNVQKYSTYTPNRNDLVIGVKNNDTDDGRFYMDDGRVVAHWKMVGAAGEPAFENGWVNYGSIHSPASFRKTGDGHVELRGLVKGGTIPGTVFTLPVGYRPGTNNYHHTISLANSTEVGVRIYEAGGVVVGNPGTSNAWVALHNIMFTPLA